MHWMLLPLKRYFDFTGRSRRMEFWMFQLFVLLVNVALVMVFMSGFPLAELAAISEAESSGGANQVPPQEVLAMFGPLFWLGLALVMLWGLFIFIPSLAVTVRRLHDRDMSGWWYGGLLIASFLPIVNIFAMLGFLVLLVLMFLPGTPGPNRFGPDPKDPGQATVFS